MKSSLTLLFAIFATAVAEADNARESVCLATFRTAAANSGAPELAQKLRHLARLHGVRYDQPGRDATEDWAWDAVRSLTQTPEPKVPSAPSASEALANEAAFHWLLARSEPSDTADGLRLVQRGLRARHSEKQTKIFLSKLAPSEIATLARSLSSTFTLLDNPKLIAALSKAYAGDSQSRRQRLASAVAPFVTEAADQDWLVHVAEVAARTFKPQILTRAEESDSKRLDTVAALRSALTDLTSFSADYWSRKPHSPQKKDIFAKAEMRELSSLQDPNERKVFAEAVARGAEVRCLGDVALGVDLGIPPFAPRGDGLLYHPDQNRFELLEVKSSKEALQLLEGVEQLSNASRYFDQATQASAGKPTLVVSLWVPKPLPTELRIGSVLYTVQSDGTLARRDTPGELVRINGHLLAIRGY